MTDPCLENLICGKADRVLNSLDLQELVHVRLGEGGITSKGDTLDRSFIACNDRLEKRFPPIGTMHVAGSARASFQTSELIEHEERMITRATEMPVPDAFLLFSVCRAHARIHVEHDALTGSMRRNLLGPPTGEIGKRCKALRPREPVRLESTHLADRCAATLCRFAANDPASIWAHLIRVNHWSIIANTFAAYIDFAM